MVNNPEYSYEINEFDKTYRVDSFLYVTIGIFILIITAILYFGEILKKYLWIPTIASLAITCYGIYKKYSVGLLKGIRFKGTIATSNFFDLEITIQKNHTKIQSATIHYSIMEEVIDNRGTSSTTYTECVYRSEKITIEHPLENVLKLQLQYPHKDIPIEYARRTISFYSQIEVEFNFKNNTSGIIKQEFPLCKLT